ncbi:MAG TPA: ABC transporter permease subunit [Streptosporangiaceae bacterium]|nr:ABC transporter permease subunit [Streptosporangiaceae bacterium]
MITSPPAQRGATPARPGGFDQVLRAEWVKFRTVRGWVIGMIVAVLAIVVLGLGPSLQGSCGKNGPASECSGPVGPGGEPVTDSFYFVHRPLAGNGSITIRLTSLTGQIPAAGAGMRSGLVPWAKAGIIIQAGTRPGSAYAAMMVTGRHGVRMQYDYTGDVPGLAGSVSAASPRWLRLTRSGDTLTGYDSADGRHWAKVGTAILAGLSPTVPGGLFATSPQYWQTALALNSVSGGPSRATGVFDHLSLQGAWLGGGWAGRAIGAAGGPAAGSPGGFQQAAGRFTVSGTGDISPSVSGPAGGGATIAQTLIGVFAGLIVVAVVGAMFMTAEYRRGLIRVTLAATPRRGRVLAAKAVVIGAVTFAAGLVAAAIVVTLGPRVLRDNGVYVWPVTPLTEVRVIAGTAAVLAAAAVIALAIGAVLRRSAAAVATVIVVIVLPYLLTVAVPILPVGATDWLARVTPAAAFAVQQTLIQYPQVSNVYAPSAGYYPLAPWAGFAVLCGWAAVALGVAAYLLRRRDA